MGPRDDEPSAFDTTRDLLGGDEVWSPPPRPAPPAPPPPPADPDDYKASPEDMATIRRHGHSSQAKDDDTREVIENTDRVAVERTGRNLKGCLPPALVGVIAIIAVIILMVNRDDGSSASADCPASAPSLGADPPLQLISATQSCPSEDQADDAAEGDDEGDADEGEQGDGADGPGGPVEVSDGVTTNVAKPSEDDLPEGAMLFSGSSAGPIGCIPCDGQSRFMSVEADGAVVGNAAAGSVATTWEEDGQITSFGARLSTPNPGGRYGINFFYADTFEYGPGVAIEVDQQSAEYQWTPSRDGTVHAGRPVVIIVGEGGNTVATGEWSLEWWFVFQPD